MIKTRLVGLLSHAKKYIVYTILWQWAALLSQVLAVFTIADLLERVVYRAVTVPVIEKTIMILALVVTIRFVCERMGARSSYLACVDVKRILREKIYDKMLKLGASYSEQVSSSEVVQVSTEGVEQLETYFGKYLPQLFYSLIAPLTLFLILCRVSVKASVILLICVPLIPISIVVVQKIAKRLLNNYWSIYTGLGDSFLENLQGLTTLKYYQSDLYYQDKKMSIATDIGHMNDSIIHHLSDSSFVLLEANYEPEILKCSSYPYLLKQRIAGPNGHLSNEAAGKTISYLLNHGLQNVMLGHLSKENNFPELAYKSVVEQILENHKEEKSYQLSVASRSAPSPVVSIG